MGPKTMLMNANINRDEAPPLPSIISTSGCFRDSAAFTTAATAVYPRALQRLHPCPFGCIAMASLRSAAADSHLCCLTPKMVLFSWVCLRCEACGERRESSRLRCRAAACCLPVLQWATNYMKGTQTRRTDRYPKDYDSFRV